MEIKRAGLPYPRCPMPDQAPTGPVRTFDRGPGQGRASNIPFFTRRHDMCADMGMDTRKGVWLGMLSSL